MPFHGWDIASWRCESKKVRITIGCWCKMATQRFSSSLCEPISTWLGQGGLSKSKEGRVFWNLWGSTSYSWGRRHLFWQLLEGPLRGKSLLPSLCCGSVPVHAFHASVLQEWASQYNSLSKSLLDLFLRETHLKLVEMWIFLDTWTSKWI